MTIRNSWEPERYEFHPYLQDSIEALPDELREMAHRVLPIGEQVLSIFVVPLNPYLARTKKQRIEPAQALVFTSNGVLHIQASTAPGQAPRSTFLRTDDLLYVHLSLILLYGRLEMAGQVNGQLETIEVFYNSSGHRLLEPALQQFLRISWENTDRLSTDLQAEEKARQNLEGLPVKYCNGLKIYALQPVEHLLGVIFQPPIRESLWMGFSRQIASPALLALTDRQIIILREEKTDESNSYGWVFTFLPIETIDTMDVMPFRKHQQLIFHLSRNGGQSQLVFPLTQLKAQDWQVLWGRYGRNASLEKNGRH